MKLPIKRKYFDQIKNGDKTEEIRDAHLTLIAEDDGEELVVEVENCLVLSKLCLSPELKESGMFTDDSQIYFRIKINGDERVGMSELGMRGK